MYITTSIALHNHTPSFIIPTHTIPIYHQHTPSFITPTHRDTRLYHQQQSSRSPLPHYPSSSSAAAAPTTQAAAQAPWYASTAAAWGRRGCSCNQYQGVGAGRCMVRGGRCVHAVMCNNGYVCCYVQQCVCI